MQVAERQRVGAVSFPFYHLTLRCKKPSSRGYPESPRHTGEHIKKKRLDLGLLQREVAEKIGVCLWTVINWETGETTPPVWYGPRIIKFLGYDPMPSPEGFIGRLWSLRWRLGLKQWELAAKLGISPSTVSDWERGRCKPSQEVRDHLGRL